MLYVPATASNVVDEHQALCLQLTLTLYDSLTFFARFPASEVMQLTEQQGKQALASWPTAAQSATVRWLTDVLLSC